MRLNEVVSTALSGTAAKLRREVLIYAICAVCALGALIMSASAALIALDPYVGLVGSRLIVAGVFGAALISIIVTLRLARPARSSTADPSAVNVHARIDAPRGLQLAQLAMIVEAVMLGYSLSRRNNR